MTASVRVQASNVVTYKERSLKAKIDPELPPSSVVEQLSSAFKTLEPHSTLCLRALDTSTLITADNLSSAISSGLRLHLVSSPHVEALDAVSALEYALNPLTPLPSSPSGRNSVPLKLSLFNLQKFIKEEEFAHEFLTRGGLRLLEELLLIRGGSENDADMVRGSFDTGRAGTTSDAKGQIGPAALSGNVLAYALQGVKAILEMDPQRGDLSDDVLVRLCEIITSARNNNVYRPAASILHLAILHEPKPISSKGKAPIRPPRAGDNSTSPRSDVSSRPGTSRNVYAGATRADGAERVYAIMARDMACLHAIVKKTEGDDLQTAKISIEIVNGLLDRFLRRTGTDSRTDGLAVGDVDQVEDTLTARLQGDLEASKIRQAIQRLMPLHEKTELTASILEYQLLHLKLLEWKRARSIDPSDADTADILQSMRKRMELDDDNASGGGIEISSTLGLECFDRCTATEPDLLDILDEQADRGEQACRLDLASEACVDALLEHYGDAAASRSLATAFEPFLLDFERLHHLAVKAYLRIWQESRAVPADTDYVSRLMSSHLSHHLNDVLNGPSNWFKLEQRLDEDYVAIRERYSWEREEQVRGEESADVKALREGIRADVMGFMRTQRLEQMKAGTWFSPGILFPDSPFRGSPADASTPHRYVILSSDQRSIYWGDFPTTSPAPFPDRFTLPNTFTLSSVTSLQPTTCRSVITPTQVIPSQTSFSLLCGGEKSLLDVVAVDNGSWAEWIDGLRWLFARQDDGEGQGVGRSDGGNVSGVDFEGLTKITRKYVDGLVEAQVRLRLLDTEMDQMFFQHEVSTQPALATPIVQTKPLDKSENSSMTRPRRTITAIVAATMSNGIGQGGGLPWRLPNEMKYFARVTTGEPSQSEEFADQKKASPLNAVIMGRKTWDGIPVQFRPLRGRRNLVITRDVGGVDLGGASDTSEHTSIQDALDHTKPSGTPPSETDRLGRVFLIGGSQLYTQALQANPEESAVDRILLTRILTPFPDCDAFVQCLSSGTGDRGWRMARHKELVEWLGWDVPEGTVEEKGVEYRFEMWVR